MWGGQALFFSTPVPPTQWGFQEYRDEQNWAWAALHLCWLVIPSLTESKWLKQDSFDLKTNFTANTDGPNPGLDSTLSRAKTSFIFFLIELDCFPWVDKWLSVVLEIWNFACNVCVHVNNNEICPPSKQRPFHALGPWGCQTQQGFWDLGSQIRGCLHVSLQF